MSLVSDLLGTSESTFFVGPPGDFIFSIDSTGTWNLNTNPGAVGEVLTSAGAGNPAAWVDPNTIVNQTPYYIPSSETFTVQTDAQVLWQDELTIDGELVLNGKMLDVNTASAVTVNNTSASTTGYLTWALGSGLQTLNIDESELIYTNNGSGGQTLQLYSIYGSGQAQIVNNTAQSLAFGYIHGIGFWSPLGSYTGSYGSFVGLDHDLGAGTGGVLLESQSTVEIILSGMSGSINIGTYAASLMSISYTGQVDFGGVAGTTGYFLTYNSGTSPTWVPSPGAQVSDATGTSSTFFITFTNTTSGQLFNAFVEPTALTFVPTTGVIGGISIGLTGSNEITLDTGDSILINQGGTNYGEITPNIGGGIAISSQGVLDLTMVDELQINNAAGSLGDVLTSQGAGNPPIWAPAAGGGLTWQQLGNYAQAFN